MDNIEEMQAGRESDAKVMHEVYGNKVCYVAAGEGYLVDKYDDWYWVFEFGDLATGIARMLTIVPEFTTDIKAAWKLVEKMVSRMGYHTPDFEWSGPLFKPEHRYLNQSPLGESCWYVLLEMDGLRQWIMADTAPLAICRAALLVNK